VAAAIAKTIAMAEVRQLSKLADVPVLQFGLASSCGAWQARTSFSGAKSPFLGRRESQNAGSYQTSKPP
jgi:hypothetical protein